METSRRAVEAYKRTRLVDFVVTDDDKVAPLYRLDEFCDMLRTSSSDMVREVVEYTMRKVDNKSPRVKQKTLRMIKYAVGKGGSEFKRQMQRQAATIRQLFEYKGQPDVLRGDALNKAVRDTAHEVIAAIFSSDDKPSQAEELNKRIMGFGSTNHDMHPAADLKKSSITNVVSDVLEFGSASIKQGLTIISGYSGANIGNMRNDTGTYRGPGLRKSLTSEKGSLDSFDSGDRGDFRASSESFGVNSGSDVHSSRASQHESVGTRVDTDANRARTLLEERLLDTITAPGGMRLQPTRESLQKFLASALKLDQNNLCHALESKLQSPAWQVRFKALCVLEAIIRQRDQELFGAIVGYFEEDIAAIQSCLQLPQTTLRDKAVKILDNLGASSKDREVLTESKDTPQPSVVYDMPDLIDTGETDLLVGDKEATPTSSAEDGTPNMNATTEDLLGEGLWAGEGGTGGETSLDDVFAGLSFHAAEKRADDSNEGLFSGLAVTSPSTEVGNLDVFSNGFHDKQKPAVLNHPASSNSFEDLLGRATLHSSVTNASPVGLTINGHTFPQSSRMQTYYNGTLTSPQTIGNLSNVPGTHANPSLTNFPGTHVNPLTSKSQMAHMNSSVLPPTGMHTSYQAALLPHTYGAGVSGNIFLQQQLPSGMGGYQGLNMGMNGTNGGNFQGLSGSSGILGDGFDFSGDASSRFSPASDSAKRENTKAFDFISDHVSAARTPKNSS